MRPDLLALTDDSLITLANRGILKRALKEGATVPPTLTESPDGTVEATFPDATKTTLPPGIPLDSTPCSCGATTVCRHRVMAVLAYRSAAESTIPATESSTPATSGTEIAAESPTPPVDTDSLPSSANPGHAQPSWSPGEFTDDQLRALLGTRAFTAARRAHRMGYRVTVRRATTADPVPSVEMSTVTVRFLVPGDLGYARADAARGTRTDAIALAVWAFRVADAIDPGAEQLEVTVGEEADGSAAATAVGSVLAPLADLLGDGVAHAGPALPAVFTSALRTLDKASARWPHDALTDLLDQLAAYRDRSARHDPLHTAALMAELVARHRAGRRDWVSVLGTEESAQTPLRHLHLIGLGARITGDAESRSVETYLAHPEARIVLTHHYTTAIPEGATPPSPAALGARRTGSACLSDLATGNIVTESAIRSANRTVRLAASRVARTSVLPSTGDWSKLPPELLISDLNAESARLATQPPTVIRPRVRGESIRAVVVDSITEIRYLPGDQRLEATLHAPTGTALITHTHTNAAPAVIDALAQTLSDNSTLIRYIAGSLTRHHGHLQLDPTALVTPTTVMAPYYATTDHPLPPGSPLPQQDPLAKALTSAIALTAELPHRGARHLPPSWFTRAGESATTLRRLGLTSAATPLETLHHSLPTATPLEALNHWTTTHLRLLLTAQQL
ncbi:hypothetical protein AB0N05_07955 [Nocardia sp. NPDC051030]|uniref:hypothetical protein n=1 Tax=Nocardia sp. NPDC051030 TaxID=3155162 RepID=UPI0034242071